MKNWKWWLAIVLIFSSGMLIGGIGGFSLARQQAARWMKAGPSGMNRMVVRQLTHELQLTTEQQATVQRVMRTAESKLERLRKQHQPEIKQVMDQAIAEIRPCLQPAQQVKLDGFFARMHKRWDAHPAEPRGPPPPDGPRPPPEH